MKSYTLKKNCAVVAFGVRVLRLNQHLKLAIPTVSLIITVQLQLNYNLTAYVNVAWEYYYSTVDGILVYRRVTPCNFVRFP